MVVQHPLVVLAVRLRLDLPVIAATLAIALSGCGGAAAPASSGPMPSSDAPLAAVPVTVSATHDAVVVTVRVSADSVVSGQPIRVRVDVLNAGLGMVSWQSGGCGLLNVAIEGPPLAQPPEGRAWPDAAGLAKWSATTSGVALDGIRPLNLPEDVAVACPANLAYDDIAPGETISAEAVWSGRSSDGVPAPSGAYVLRYAFPYLARVPVDQLGIDMPQEHPIRVDLPITLDGPAFAGIPSTAAIDAAFNDPRVAAWVDRALPKERLGGAEIRLVDGRWRFTIHVAGERKTVVFVDPSTGGVVEVQLAD